MSLPLPALIAQLRAAYPNASLMSELLAIESNTYVVRALIQIGSMTLASGLAAAAEVETAEDRAKCRAIETLLPPATALTAASATSAVVSPFPEGAIAESAASSGQAADISSRMATVPSLPPVAQSSPGEIAPKTELLRSAAISREPQSKPASPFPIDTASPESLTDWDNPLQSPPTPSNLDLDFDLNTLLQDSSPSAPPPPAPAEEPPAAAADLFAAVNTDPNLPIDPPVNLSDLNLTKLKLPHTSSADAETAAPPEKPSRRKSAAPSVAPPEPAPTPPTSGVTSPTEIDRSEEIARIGVEMKRLGWDTKKGRDHLQSTYGKRSRQELNDDELMDFLRYLETQPSSAQMPF